MSYDTIEQPRPATTTGVIPYLGMNGRAGAAADFYVRAFGAREFIRLPFEGGAPGDIMHCHIEINGGALMLTDCVAPGEPPVSPQGFHLQLMVTDAKAWWDRAVAAGCTVQMPLERMFWGDLWGLLVDPFGIIWGIDQPGDA